MNNDYTYEAEKWRDGSIMTLYRINGFTAEEYIDGEGWKETSDARDVLHGETFTMRVTDQEAENHIKDIENYIKNHASE